MLSYKLNNSYTIYINFVYINECKKACKSKHVIHNQHGASVKGQDFNMISKAKSVNKSIEKPLPNDTSVLHKKYGVGKIIDTDTNGILSVAFGQQVIKFVYPEAFKQGFLICA